MKSFLCPYCQHWHVGAIHLRTCELIWVQRSDIHEVLSEAEKHGVYFGLDARGQLFIRGPQEMGWAIALLVTRAFDICKYFNVDPERAMNPEIAFDEGYDPTEHPPLVTSLSVSEKWQRTAQEAAVAPSVQHNADDAEAQAFHAWQIATGQIPPDA